MRGLYAYIRVSTARQGEHGSSLQEQRSAIEAYAKRHQFEIIEWFEETETAAKRGRSVFTRMLRQLSRGKADGVVIHKIDRGARNLRDWADLGEMIDQGIQVQFANESIDLNTRGGRLSADIQAVVAADYIRNLREEVRKGFYGRLKQGIYPLPAPIGYRDEGAGKPKSLDPVAAPFVKKAFELYATGRFSLLTLGDELYRLGLRSKSGKRISETCLSTVLNSPFYLGLIRIKRTNELFEGKHPPLVSKRTFDQVQQVLAGKIRNQGMRHDFAYRRRLRCTSCHYALIAEIQKGHTYYRCHTATCPCTCLREEGVDQSIRDMLGALRLTAQEFAQLSEDFAKRLEGADDEDRNALAGTRLQIDQLKGRLDRLTDAYVDRLVERDTYEERKAALLYERTALIERLENLTSKTLSTTVRVQRFLELMQRLCEAPLPVQREELRDLALSVTSNLGVQGKDLVPAWRPVFSAVANRAHDADGPPERGTPRTTSERVHLAPYGPPERGTGRTTRDVASDASAPLSTSNADMATRSWWWDAVWSRIPEDDFAAGSSREEDNDAGPQQGPIQRRT